MTPVQSFVDDAGTVTDVAADKMPAFQQDMVDAGKSVEPVSQFKIGGDIVPVKQSRMDEFLADRKSDGQPYEQVRTVAVDQPDGTRAPVQVADSKRTQFIQDYRQHPDFEHDRQQSAAKATQRAQRATAQGEQMAMAGVAAKGAADTKAAYAEHPVVGVARDIGMGVFNAMANEPTLGIMATGKMLGLDTAGGTEYIKQKQAEGQGIASTSKLAFKTGEIGGGIAQMAGAPALGFGLVATSALGSAQDTYDNLKAQGMDEGKARAWAAGQFAVQAVPMALAQKFGVGPESKAMAAGALAKMTDAELQQFGKAALTQVARNLSAWGLAGGAQGAGATTLQKLSGENPNASWQDVFGEGARGLIGGVIGASPFAAAHYRSMSQAGRIEHNFRDVHDAASVAAEQRSPEGLARQAALEADLRNQPMFHEDIGLTPDAQEARTISQWNPDDEAKSALGFAPGDEQGSRYGNDVTGANGEGNAKKQEVGQERPAAQQVPEDVRQGNGADTRSVETKPRPDESKVPQDIRPVVDKVHAAVDALPSPEQLDSVRQQVNSNPSQNWRDSAVQIGEVNGKKVLAVNGDVINKNVHMDFVDGDNGAHDKYNADGRMGLNPDEIIVDAQESVDRMRHIIVHEAIEAHQMENGANYDKAHPIANLAEREYMDKREAAKNSQPAQAPAPEKEQSQISQGDSLSPEVKASMEQQQPAQSTAERLKLDATPQQWLRDNSNQRGAISLGEPIGFKIAQEYAHRVWGKAVNTVKMMIARAPFAKDSAMLLDAADNKAYKVATEDARTPIGILGRAIGRKIGLTAIDRLEKEGTALTFVVESGNDPARFEEMVAKVNAPDSKASTKWKLAVNQAAELARANWDGYVKASDAYQQNSAYALNLVRDNGVARLERNNYVAHAQDIEQAFELGSSGGVGGAGTTAQHMRVHETYADSMHAGIEPESLNAFALQQKALQSDYRLVNRKAWAEQLKGAVDSRTGQSVYADLIEKPRPLGEDGKPIGADPTRPDLSWNKNDVVPPAGYVAKDLGGGLRVAVLKEYAGIHDQLVDPSWWDRTPGGAAIMKLAQTGKHVTLALDTFHLGRMAFNYSMLKLAGVTTAEMPKFWTKEGGLLGHKQGAALLDHSIPELRRMADSGEIPKGWLKNIEEQKRISDLLVSNGYMIGRVVDAMHQEWTQKIPITGNFQKFLFGPFMRGIMHDAGRLEFERQRAMNPKLTDQQVARKVGSDLNILFGTLGRQGWFKDRTTQDTMKVLFLAQQWNEGLIKGEIGAIKQGLTSIPESFKQGRLTSGALLRAKVAMMATTVAAAQVINMLSRGQPTTQNKEEGVEAKISGFIPDVIGGGQGLWFNPTSLPADITTLLMRTYERKGNIVDTLHDFIKSRAGTLMKPLDTFYTKQNALGKPLKPADVWPEFAKAFIPVPIAAPTLYGAVKQGVTGEKQEVFAGQFEKQLLATFGVRTTNVPTNMQRISQLAKQYQERIKPGSSDVQYPASEFSIMRKALELGNAKMAREEIERVTGNGTPQEQEIAIKAMDKNMLHWAKAGFAPAQKYEASFIGTLNPEQRQAYIAAKGDKIKVFNAYMYLRQKMIASKPDQAP